MEIEFWNTAHLFQDIRSQLNLDFFLLGDFNSYLSMPPRWRWWRLEYWVWHRLTEKPLCYLEISFKSGKSTCSPTWFLCSTGLLRLHRKTYMQGVPKNRLLLEPKIVTKLQCDGAKFPLDMTWEQLILLCLTEVRNDNFFFQKWAHQIAVERGVSYWWLSGCAVAPPAFCYLTFLGHPVQYRGHKCFLMTWLCLCSLMINSLS